VITRPDETTLAVTSAGPAPYRHNMAKPENTNAKEADNHLNLNLTFIIPFAALAVCPTTDYAARPMTSAEIKLALFRVGMSELFEL